MLKSPTREIELPPFNPLHCGAVVASRGATPSAEPRGSAFNPLHCGAVVASELLLGAGWDGCPLSIPFIAGQWSLRRSRQRCRRRRRCFQSPSLRGSGRFAQHGVYGIHRWVCFQSPSLRGSGRFDAPTGVDAAHVDAAFQSPSLRGSGRFTLIAFATITKSVLSIPFIAGQWSLLESTGEAYVPEVDFQSPSLRGSGRFMEILLGASWNGSPLSIPFIAGQWSLPARSSALARVAASSFNPLHCGAVVASLTSFLGYLGCSKLSIPFIAGQWSLPGSC